MTSKTYIYDALLTISMISKTYIVMLNFDINDINDLYCDALLTISMISMTYIVMLNFDINDIKDLYYDAQF